VAWGKKKVMSKKKDRKKNGGRQGSGLRGWEVGTEDLGAWSHEKSFALRTSAPCLFVGLNQGVQGDRNLIKQKMIEQEITSHRDDERVAEKGELCGSNKHVTPLHAGGKEGLLWGDQTHLTGP